jgi:hypothetical protein
MLKDMKKLIYFLFITLAVLVTSCELPDNIDPKYPEIVSADVLFSYGEIELANQVGSINENINISRLLAQYHSEVTYVTESRYNFSDRQIPDQYFIDLYEHVLMNLKDAYDILDATVVATPTAIAEKANKMAIIEVCNVYAYQVLVDAFGNVPYTEALMGSANSRPKYDDAYTIYKDLITRLNAAIAAMNTANGSFGSADVMYGGSVTKWKQFAATLKLRIGLRLADVAGSGSSTIISEALASGVFTSEVNSAIFKYNGIYPYVNSYYNEYQVVGRQDYCPTNTIVNMMNTLNDPRRPIWFTTVEGDYIGLDYGLQASSDYGSFSNFSAMMLEEATYPVILSDYVEVEFLLAEACERSIGGAGYVPGNAESHYNKAIRASMAYWGVDSLDAKAYLAQPAVAYTTATGTWQEKIGNQKWLALFDRGEEAWAEWRRLDYPILSVPDAMTAADIPVRMPYPYNENKNNKTNYTAAVTAMGGDDASIRLFWDTQPYSGK